MRIFHGPHNIIGAAGMLARAQRAFGAEAYSYCYATPKYRYPSDYTIEGGMAAGLKRWLSQTRQFDCFQFYFGESLTGHHLWDVPWLKSLGKKVFFTFCGCDIRDAKATIAAHEYSACKNCWPTACSANRKDALEVATRYADGSFVMTPDLLEFVPGSTLLPTPANLDTFERLAAKVRGLTTRLQPTEVVIAHAPSSRMLKGTSYIEETVATLQNEGYPVRLLLIENMTNRRALLNSALADIVVDQLLIGAYGHYSVEAMALGKPVVCGIRDDLRQHYPSDLPVISANPRTIAAVLRDLIARRRDWADLGRAGVEYVRRHHDYRVVAGKMLRAYERTALPVAA